MTPPCSVEDCQRPKYVRGYCVMHYNRFLSHGDPLVTLGGPRVYAAPTHLRFNVRAEHEQTAYKLAERLVVVNDCWEWQGSRDSRGYGRCHAAYGSTITTKLTHRAFYIATTGDVPDDMPLDHLCRNTSCANPAHLEIVSHRENALRGLTIPARSAAQTHCVSGHPFDNANTLIRRNGTRMCRKCNARRQRETKARRAAASSAAHESAAAA